MALFGMDLETYTPFQGCTTFRTDLTLDRIPGHMAVCLAEMDRAVFYRNINPITIEIASRAMKGDYLALTGEYVGQGMSVYEITLEGKEFWHTHTVRATDRKALRAALKLLYPTCKVGR